MGLNGLIHKKRPSMLRKTGLLRDAFHLSAPTICDTIFELGLGYVLVEPEECNLTLVREFYTNLDTSFGESTKVKIRGQMVHFSA
ncbi:hypothetical protein HAX54_030552, partial [Datura stramonium]|nr:hypothetical protein [Datura stramonium]